VDDDEWLYDSDDETPQTLLEKWENYWKKKKENRRHPTMKYFEKLAVMGEHNRQLDKEDYQRKARRDRKQKLHKGILRKRHKEFRDYVAKTDKARHDKDLKNRTRYFKSLKVRMGLFEEWGIENDNSKKKEAKDFEESERKRIEKETKEKRKKEKDDTEARLEGDRLAGLKLTQDTLTIMRRAGTIAANHDETKHVPQPTVPQRETSESVVLQVRLETAGSITRCSSKRVVSRTPVSSNPPPFLRA